MDMICVEANRYDYGTEEDSAGIIYSLEQIRLMNLVCWTRSKSICSVI